MRLVLVAALALGQILAVRLPLGKRLLPKIASWKEAPTKDRLLERGSYLRSPLGKRLLRKIAPWKGAPTLLRNEGFGFDS
jgi:hypothetical protein